MDRVSLLFLDALKASLEGRIVKWKEISETEAILLMRQAEAHNVLPMLYEAMYNCPTFRQLPQGILDRYRRTTLQQISLQTMKTVSFRQMYEKLRGEGIELCVVKGLICRSLYPDPDSRISSDEDVYVAPEHFQEAHEGLMRFGMTLNLPEEDPGEAFEVSYRMEGNPLFVEMHRHLFEPEAEAVSDMNPYFDGVFDKGKARHGGECGLIEMEIDGCSYLTMNHTDNLLYLICHSFKHFLHSGFGLRQVCDINLYAMAYGDQIDWEYVLACLQDLRADMFAASLFKIGARYLTFDPAKAHYPASWQSIQVDEGLMLADLMDAGVYGQNLNRRRSSNITLNARVADRRGKKASSGRIAAMMGSLFPPAEQLKLRYGYLKRCPWLLPLAWVQRLLRFRKETAGKKGQNEAAESIRIGNERVELMRAYGIIK